MTSERPPNRLTALAPELERCAKCGECRRVCPVFAAEPQEKYVARGRLTLVEALAAGEITPSDGVRDALDNCLLCLACVRHCGSQVAVDLLVTAARAHAVDLRGGAGGLTALARLLASGRGLLGLAARSGSLLQPLAFARLPHASGLRSRFPLPLLGRLEYVPPLARRPLRDTVPERRPATGGGPTVLFFTGCSVNFFFAEIGRAVLKVLDRLGCGVIVPGGQVCCGTPMESGGAEDAARDLARRNVDVLTAAGVAGLPVVVPCASCGYTLTTTYPRLLADDPDYAPRARALAARTRDIAAFLVRDVGLPAVAARLARPVAGTLTYHDPCHLLRGQGVGAEPRELLRLVAADGLAEMDAADRCCGSGGLYALRRPQTARRILDAKLAAAESTGADVIATGCPACIVQLRGGLLRTGSRQRVRHTLELLADAMD